MKDGLMKEVGLLQQQYRKLVSENRLTKKAICDLVIPFRDKHNLTDIQALQIARNELSIISICDVIERMETESED